jgi:16S rRNA (cytidine1402-2'-O)-methyltransferase
MSDEAPGCALAPALYVVATPLGNLQDISQRAIEVLRHAALIACEDTRHTQRLLEHLGVRAKLVAVHEHNEASAAELLVKRIESGEPVALVSDAGTPAISDPGARAVRAVQAAGCRVVPVPGPSAVAAALSASGLLFSRFLFQGFLPPKSAARRAVIESLAPIDAALVFFEAPHRIEETLADLVALLPGEREIVIARELTKLFEEIARMPLANALAWLAADSNRKRGEFVLLLGPPPAVSGLKPEAIRVLERLLAEVPLKTAARLAAEISGESKNALYQHALQLKSGDASDL